MNSGTVTVGDLSELINSFLLLHGRAADKNFIQTEYPPSSPLIKRYAASMLHSLLLDIFSEPDEKNWDSALELQDLYECRVCTAHIAQVYCKGIIPAFSQGVFGSHEPVSQNEALMYLNRAFFRDQRVLPPLPKKDGLQILNRQSFNETVSALAKKKIVCIGDVECSLPKGLDHIAISFSELRLNPYSVSDDLSIPIFVCGENEYFNRIAADILTEYGFRSVSLII